MKERASRKVWQVLEDLNEEYNTEFDFPHIEWTVIGTTAGRAWLNQWRIQLNEQLCKENVEDFISQTIPHEVAHLVAYKVYGDDGHGNGWKSVMRALDLDPTRCHDYDTARVEGKRGRSSMYR
ncbi:MAG: SprT-like domain-containing protein [Terrimicrobiaceae bacterium]